MYMIVLLFAPAGATRYAKGNVINKYFTKAHWQPLVCLPRRTTLSAGCTVFDPSAKHDVPAYGATTIERFINIISLWSLRITASILSVLALPFMRVITVCDNRKTDIASSDAERSGTRR
jgi:hypothetical protein